MPFLVLGRRIGEALTIHDKPTIKVKVVGRVMGSHKTKRALLLIQWGDMEAKEVELGRHVRYDLGPDVFLSVSNVEEKQVRLSIDAPRTVRIERDELMGV